MQLKLVFTNVKYFEGLFNDGTELTNVAHEDEIVEATQEICGRLFLEAWSDNMAHGFPTPKGCYYRVIGDESTDQRIPQIGIVFEEKNGLRAGYNYQIVMRAVAKHQLRADDPQGEGTYLEIYSMDDVIANPYGAVELGLATMSTASVASRRPRIRSSASAASRSSAAMTASSSSTPTFHSSSSFAAVMA
jgi:hypothetical protein